MLKQCEQFSYIFTIVYCPFSLPSDNWLLKKLCSKTEKVVTRLAHDRNTGKGKTPTQLSWATVALRIEMQNIFGANYLVLHLAFYMLLELQPFIWLVISWMQPEKSEKKISFCKMSLCRQSECWISSTTGKWSTKTSCVTALVGNSKLKERSFSSHENSKQRLVRDNCLMPRKIITQ